MDKVSVARPAGKGESARNLIDAALQYAQRGWRMFPCNGKTPLIRGWPQQATCDVSKLQAWASQFADCNWGAATGPESGFFVVDCDGEAGLGWLKSQVDAGNELPETWSVRTARGLHLYFAWPAGFNIRNSVKKLAPGVDVRGVRGCVIVPPSVHPDGPRYETVDDTCPVSPAPAWFLTVLTAVEKTPADAPTKAVALPAFEIIPNGRRNVKLASIGGYLRRKGCDQVEIDRRLQDVNTRRCVPPLLNIKVTEIAASVARYPIGGPDPLEVAWDAIQGAGPTSGFMGFMALAEALQRSREGMEVALPLVRIAALFGVHFTSVQQWRKRAVAVGLLQPVGHYIAHRRAGTYRVPLLDSKETKPLTKPLTTLTTGLVRVDESPIVRGDGVPIVRVADSQDAATSFDFGDNADRFLRHETGQK